jgi:hypothetical protein
LRKMAPAKERALFTEFLKGAVAEYSVGLGHLTILGQPAGNEIQRFEQLLDMTVQGDSSSWLNPQQFEQCLNEIIRDSTLIPRVMLMQDINVSKWSIAGRTVATGSCFSLFYGIKPCVSTLLFFDALQDFYHIRQILKDLHFCTLNEIHLKAVKKVRED